MVQILCPNCGRRVSYNPKMDVDIEHTCNSGNETIDNEDVFRIGNYIDEATGNTVVVPNAMSQGEVNQLQGTVAGIEGGDVEQDTARGNRVSTHRTRQHIEHIKLKEV